jgi:hypothetical protein
VRVRFEFSRKCVRILAKLLSQSSRIMQGEASSEFHRERVQM